MAESGTVKTDREKRQHPRVPFYGDIEVTSDGQEALRTFGINLSREGASFSTPGSLRVGAGLSLRFKVGERAFSLRATVRHLTHVVSEIHSVDRASTFVVGVQFASLTAEDSASLERALDELRALEDDGL
jgi:hypothetical protein